MAAGSLVAIVDDDDAVRRSLASLLTRTGFDVTEFESGDQFLSAPDADRFCCVLLDLQMPGIDGLAVLRALAERGESPPVLVITGHGCITAAVAAIKLGAHDFLEKPYEANDLLAAIRTASATNSEGRKARILCSEAAARLKTLSQRQLQVLRGILHGQPNKIIAYELGLSIRTVEAYRAQLLERLGIRSTAQAVRLAIAGGME